VVIPPNTPSGPASLSISVGAALTQAGVTIAVK
jgi:BioD-like phosphotransacetylase family protein